MARGIDGIAQEAALVINLGKNDGLLVVVEILAVEDLANGGRLEVVQRLYNRGTAICRHFAALIALGLLERDPPLGAVNERDKVAAR